MLHRQSSSNPLSIPSSPLNAASFSTSTLANGPSSNGIYISCSPTFHSPARLGCSLAKRSNKDLSSPQKESLGANRNLSNDFRDLLSGPFTKHISVKDAGESEREPPSDHQDQSDTYRGTTPTMMPASVSAPTTPLRCPRPMKAVLVSGTDCTSIERDVDGDIAGGPGGHYLTGSHDSKAESKLEVKSTSTSVDYKHYLDGDLTAGREVIQILSQPSSPALRLVASTNSRVMAPLASPVRQPSAPTMTGPFEYPRTGSTPNLYIGLTSPLKKPNYNSHSMNQPYVPGNSYPFHPVSNTNQQHSSQGVQAKRGLNPQNVSPTEGSLQTASSQGLLANWLEYAETPNYRIFTPPCRNLHPLSFDSRIHKSSMFNDSFLSLSPPPTSPGIDRDDDDCSDIGVMPMAVGAGIFHRDY